MPVKVQADLPVKEILESENIFVMDEFRAVHQDMRPLQVLILNNMPVKQDYGAAAAAGVVQYTAAGGCHFHEHQDPCVTEYSGQPSEQVLHYL